MRQIPFPKLFLDHKKGTVKTLATLDLEKVCPDLIENLIEWIVDGDHEVMSETRGENSQHLSGLWKADQSQRCFLFVLKFPKGGAVLVFLPGMQEITSLYETLQQNRAVGSRNKHK